jgi:hypothetical protein
MIRDVLEQLDTQPLGTAALVLFLAVFLAILVSAWTRSPRQIERWSRLPLTSGEEPKPEPEGRS